MDTDDLSNEASDFLKTDLGCLARECDSEREYLEKAFTFIQNILYDQEEYLESWALEEPLNETYLINLTKYIETVQSIPIAERTYEKW